MEALEGTTDLKAMALSLGFQTVGVCSAAPPLHLDHYERWLKRGFAGSMAYLHEHLPLKRDPQALLPGVQSVVAVALNYNQPNPSREGYPRIARYALGRDYHRVVRAKLKRLAEWITAQNPSAECRICVDSAPILEREYANRAGLGFFGKNTLLIDPKRGSWFVLGLLLTTVPFEADRPAVGGCGSCTRCIDACPTGAIVNRDGVWQIDSRECISYLTIEHRGPLPDDGKVGDWTFGCDVCQEVCPFNEERPTQPLRGESTQEPNFLKTRQWPTLQALSALNYEEWNELTQGSPVRRAGHAGLARNARLNLKESPTSGSGSG